MYWIFERRGVVWLKYTGVLSVELTYKAMKANIIVRGIGGNRKVEGLRTKCREGEDGDETLSIDAVPPEKTLIIPQVYAQGQS